MIDPTDDVRIRSAGAFFAPVFAGDRQTRHGKFTPEFRSFLCFALLAAFCYGSAPVAQVFAQQAAKPEAPQLEFVFEELVTLAPAIHPGETPFGDRNIVPITGGTFHGPRLRGKILAGGWDWQLATKSGCHSLQANYMIETDDGVIINVVNKGTSCSFPGTTGKLFTSPSFEAPLGRYAWLNSGAYIGTLEGATVEGKPAVRIRFFAVK